ncbi:hypothetical protein [Vibrio caribbeanicus]|uniref:hypothetical protein n=1 Tax=Vibrio caribbeanicus TaxID=701175 RepID=UPI002283BD41|nr:hypothetical protein [Vibrio caribbeanicus]MCY9844244.1 hypothetical protein [Vibrio caribbeanicus]
MRELMNRKSLLLRLTVFTTFWLVSVLLYYPGGLSVDSFLVLEQANSGIISDGYSPIHILFVKALYNLQSSYFLVIAVGLLFYHTGIFLISYYLFRHSLKKTVLFSLFFLTFPPIAGIMGALWSDVTMASLFILFIGLILTSLEVDSNKVYFSILFISALVLFLGMSQRHNGAAAALPLCIFFSYSLISRLRTKKSYLLSFIIGIFINISFFVVATSINNLTSVDKKNYWRSVPLYDIAAISCSKKKLYFEQKIISETSLSNICSLYSKRSYLPLAFGEQVHAISDKEIYKGAPVYFIDSIVNLNEKIIANWLHAVFNNFGYYVYHRFSLMYSMLTGSQWGLWVPVYNEIPPNDFGVDESSTYSSLYFMLMRGFNSIPVLSYPISYLIISLFVFVISTKHLLRDNSERYFITLILSMSSITHFSGLFFFAVSSDYRYAHWIVLSGLLSSFLLLHPRRT